MDNPKHGIRLNKYISESGICSRRDADRLIESGQVKVNGKLAVMGIRVTDADQVVMKGKKLKAKPKAVYLAYHKPAGVICTTDRQVPGNIVDAINHRARIFPIGRLDKDSTGLILLTNDGDIVNKILRAGNAHEKEYIVDVDKPINHLFIAKMASGVPVLDTVTQACKVRQVSAKRFNIILTQGLNRQIRRMTEFLGYTVCRLQRTRIMNIQLEKLKAGQWRELASAELAAIDKLLVSSSKTEEASKIKKGYAGKQPLAGSGHLSGKQTSGKRGKSHSNSLGRRTRPKNKKASRRPL